MFHVLDSRYEFVIGAGSLLDAIGEEVGRCNAKASIGLCVFAGLFAAHAGFEVAGFPQQAFRQRSDATLN